MFPALVIHGGAGPDQPDLHPELQRGAEASLAAGWQVLHNGGSALDAVEIAVRVLEADPAFNAGLGSCLTHDGSVEMDASIMSGSGLRLGAVAIVQGVRHPIRIARRLLDEGRTVLLAGAAAATYAAEHGLERCDPDELITPRQRQLWQRRQPTVGGSTVGAVAVDRHGSVAAATSTGGMPGRPSGRIGDSPIAGAGTYADDTLGAASATGEGEAILRLGLTRTALEALRDGRDPQAVANDSIATLERRTGGRGGLILVDPLGRIAWAKNTPAMTVGWIRGGEVGQVRLV